MNAHRHFSPLNQKWEVWATSGEMVADSTLRVVPMPIEANHIARVCGAYRKGFFDIEVLDTGEFIFMYRYILCESRSQFDTLPLPYLVLSLLFYRYISCESCSQFDSLPLTSSSSTQASS